MSVLDLYNLKEFEHDIVSKILTIYFTDVTKDIEAVKIAFSKDDIKQLKHFSHKIVGSSRTVGAINIANIASEIESHIITNNNILGMSNMIAELDSSFEDLKIHVDKNNLI